MISTIKFDKKTGFTFFLYFVTINPSTISKIQNQYCTKTQFQCDNGQCIHKSFICDGISDCIDGSDETYKHCQNKICEGSSFQCDYGACIDKEYYCDGLNQCNDGSDEQPQKCKVSGDEHRNIKREISDACAVPAPSANKTITYACGDEEGVHSCESNGFVQHSTIATVKCQPSYQAINKINTFYRSICLGKIWIPPITECFKKCEEAIPVNGDLRCYHKGMNIPCGTSSLLPGTKIRLSPTCKTLQGYDDYADKNPEITCQNNGSWDKPLFLCVPENDICNQHDGQSCVKVQDCPSAKTIIDNRKAILCGFHSPGVEKICCPMNTKQKNESSSLNKLQTSISFNPQNWPSSGRLMKSARIAYSNCKKYSMIYETECVNDELSVGKEAQVLPNEYPHIATLITAKNYKNLHHLCLGSLISETFILGVATCAETYLSGEIKYAIFGNLNHQLATIQLRDRNYNLTYDIIKRYDHPNFSLRSLINNIALFQLKTPVVISSQVRPACLYPPNLQYEIKSNSFVTTGWGTRSGTSALTKSIISIVNDEKCDKEKFLSYNHDLQTLMCAGNSKNGEKFCKRTIGDILQARVNDQSCTWTVFGLKSDDDLSKDKSCQDDSNQPPDNYLKVSHYLDWIQSTVWP